MTEKDKDRAQKALVAAWEIRDGLKQAINTLNPGTIDAPNSRDASNAHDKLEELSTTANSLIVELAVLSSNVIGSIVKLEAEVQSLQEKLEVVELDHSSLEDEVAALQTEVQELKASED